jgi:two-component system sensor histidine kinase PilS (NtrC family)
VLPIPTPTPDPSGPRTGEFPVGPVTQARAIDRFALPGPRTLLGIVLAARVALTAALITRAAGASGQLPFEAWLVVAIVGAAVAATIWLIFDSRGGRFPSATSLLLHATVDVLVVTGLVAFMTRTATPATPVAALYVALVTLYALLLPVGRGLLGVAFAVVCYVVVTLRSATATPGAEFWTQLGVIAFVGGLIAVLGNRLANASREQRALADALAQARLEADEILATIQSGVITVDGEGRLAYINPRARRILGGDGFTAGQPVMETLRARSRDLHDALDRGVRHGARMQRGEASVRRNDGSLFPVGVSTTTFYRPGGGPPSVTAIFTDISDLKRLQEFRLRAERLEAVAALSASLAHEIRNPLMAIRSAVEQLSADTVEGGDSRILADLCMRESERLNRLLSEFLDFSRVRVTRFETLDLLEVLQEAATFVIEHPTTRGVKVLVDGQSLEVEADRDLLHRIASNLMLNAAQALDGRGTVRAEVGLARQGEAPVGPVERRIKITIRDDGPGIPDSVRERLFEPFVVGRPGGTGLGLAIVQRAVAAHRGIILVDTAPGAGTTFSIFLPASGDREDAA